MHVAVKCRFHLVFYCKLKITVKFQRSLPVSSNFTVLLSSASMTSGLPSISWTSSHTHSTVDKTPSGNIMTVCVDWIWKGNDQWERVREYLIPSLWESLKVEAMLQFSGYLLLMWVFGQHTSGIVTRKQERTMRESLVQWMDLIAKLGKRKQNEKTPYRTSSARLPGISNVICRSWFNKRH